MDEDNQSNNFLPVPDHKY